MGSEEIDRIRRVYEGYDHDERRRARYGPSPAHRAMLAERWDTIGHLLHEIGWHSLRGRRVLELGCGDGSNLATLIRRGADPALLTGIDLSSERLVSGRRTHGDLAFALADGASLPFQPETFDAVLLFTVISSILDRELSTRLAREAQRVLVPAGIIVWYDMRVGNPRNRNVRGIGRGELERLFPNYRLRLRSLTVAPPLARILGPATPQLYPRLGAIPFLRSHYAGVFCRSNDE